MLIIAGAAVFLQGRFAETGKYQKPKQNRSRTIECVVGRVKSRIYIGIQYLATCISRMQQRPHEAEEPHNVKDQRTTLFRITLPAGRASAP